MDVSIIVSTYNRKADVGRFLASLATAEVRPAISWELVLVDNNSTDETAELVREFARDARFPVHYAFEARRGKSYGLNTGIALATGRILAFTDDDVIVPPDWIRQIVNFLDGNPACSCVGGMVKLHDSRDAHVSVRLSAEPDTIRLSNFKFNDIQIMGCNMAMRADLLRVVGGFDIDLGPGSRTGGGDDVDMLYRILRSGHDLYYYPNMWVSHNHGRRTPEQLAGVRRGYSNGRGAFYCKHCLCGDGTVARWAYWDCRSLLRHAFGAKARAVALEVTWLVSGALRYICFHDWWGARRLQRPAVDRSGIVQ